MSHAKRVFVAALVFLLPFFAEANTEQHLRIVGGQDASSGEWPWMVALVSPVSFSYYYGQFCGGSLIHEDWVLTAAHCVTDLFDGTVIQPSEVNVVVGGYDLSDSNTGTESAVRRIIVHPNFNGFTLGSDLALLELQTPVSGVTISPLSSAMMSTYVTVGDSATVIGWGSSVAYNLDDLDDLDPPSSFPVILQEAVIPYVDNSICNTNLAGFVTDDMLCAGFQQGGASACQGDSGGPLMVNLSGNWYQMGIVSWGIGCAAAGYYGVYTRVSRFENWIRQYTSGISIIPSYDFGAVVPGFSATATLTVTNNNNQVESITAIDFASTDSIFTLTNESCTITSLAAGQSCELNVQFAPASGGEYSNSMNVSTTSASTPSIQSSLIGVGLNASDFDMHVGSPGLVWGTGGDGSWFTQSTTGTEGNTALQSPVLNDNQQSVLVAHISLTQQETVYFNWRVSSEYDFDYLELFLDGDLVQHISGEVAWVESSVDVTAGQHVIEWRYTKDTNLSNGSDAGFLDNVSIGSPNNINVFGENAIIPDESYTILDVDADLESPGMSWSTNTINGWYSQSSISSSGSTSVQSAEVAGDVVSEIITNVTLYEQGSLSFDWKTSGLAYYDFLVLVIDGNYVDNISGATDWVSREEMLSAGQHEIRWMYTTLGSIGGNAAWLDNVHLFDPGASGDGQLSPTDLNAEEESWLNSLGAFDLSTGFIFLIYGLVIIMRKRISVVTQSEI